MNIKRIKLDAMKISDYNPRIHNDVFLKNLKNSMDTYGYVEPIVWNERTKNIVGGHARFKVLESEGVDEIDVVVVDLEDADEKALNVSLNKISGDWDESLLAPLIDELQGYDLDMGDLGFDVDEINNILSAFMPDIEEDNYDIPEEPSNERGIKEGDVWVLGDHRLMCGDATKAEDVAKLMDGEKADITLTSPPYNVGTKSLGGNKNLKFQKYLNDSDEKTETEYEQFLCDSLELTLNVSTHQFYNIQQLSGNKRAVIRFLNKYVEHLADVSIWFKGGGQPAIHESVMNSRFEYVFIFHKYKNPTRQIKTCRWRNISNVFELNPAGKNKNSDIHAAVFPLEFASHYIKIGCESKGSVIDPFGGCGTTLMACEELNRKCYMMELDPQYCNVIIDRWEMRTNKKADMIDEGEEEGGS